MVSILSFVKPDDGSFDPETLRVMGEAYEAACKSLGTFATAAVRDGVAARIFDAARGGERDPAKLQEAGLRPWRK